MKNYLYLCAKINYTAYYGLAGTGILIFLKNGKTYNAIGVEIR